MSHARADEIPVALFYSRDEDGVARVHTFSKEQQVAGVPYIKRLKETDAVVKALLRRKLKTGQLFLIGRKR